MIGIGGASMTVSSRRDEVAPGLKRIEDATRIRRRILIAFERAELATDAAQRQRLLTFAIVGGGAAGGEMGGAISAARRHSRPLDFRRIDPTAARIVLLEAGPRIMPTLPENLSDYVRRTVAKKGVEVMTSSRVTSCDAHGVELEHGRLDADTIIWAAARACAMPSLGCPDLRRAVLYLLGLLLAFTEPC